MPAHSPDRSRRRACDSEPLGGARIPSRPPTTRRPWIHEALQHVRLDYNRVDFLGAGVMWDLFPVHGVDEVLNPGSDSAGGPRDGPVPHHILAHPSNAGTTGSESERVVGSLIPLG